MGRTRKNIKLRIPEKPRKIKGFRSGGYPIATTISSQSRYDHFDTSPYNSYSVLSTDRIASNQGIPLPAQHLRKNRIDALL